MTLDHRQNPKLLWGIVSGLIVVIIAVLIITQFFSRKMKHYLHIRVT